MESNSNKRIEVEVRLKKHDKVIISVLTKDKVSTLQSSSPESDFFYNGSKLDCNKTFEEQQITKSCIIHTYEKNKLMIHFNPIYFKFFNGNVCQMNVPIVWTFKRAAEALGASSGVDPTSISFIFAGRRLSPEKAFIDETGMQKQTTLHVRLNQI